MRPPDAKRRPVWEPDDAPNITGGDKVHDTGPVQSCPMACAPSCSYRCPITLPDAVTALVAELLVAS